MRAAACLCLAMTLVSCRVGPKYKVPTAPATAAFKEPPPPDWKEAHPADETLKGNWWELFCDTLLNTLEEQVTISNFDIAAAESRFRSARAAITVARAGLFPSVTVGASADVSHIPSSSLRRVGATAGGGTFYQLPVDFNYEVDAWGSVRSNVAANVATAQATAADLETVRLSTHAELALDYFALRGLDEQRRLLETSVASYEQALQLTTNRYNQGIASRIDVAQAQVQLDTVRAELTDVGVARSQFEHAMATLTGKPPAELTIPYSPAGTAEPPAVPVSLPSELLERRPDIASAERHAASANALIGVARAAYFPTISLTGQSGVENAGLASVFSWPSQFWSLGASLTQLAFDGGSRKGLTAEAKSNFDSAVATYRQTVLAGFQDVEDNLAALRILEEEARQQAVAVESSRTLLDLANNRYRAGIAIYLEVIVANNSLLTNEQTAATIHTKRMTATVLLIKALGGGWDRSQLPL
jgi:NodT family efflux transporter outer membrane factor (OMF) lipoprotein